MGVRRTGLLQHRFCTVVGLVLERPPRPPFTDRQWVHPLFNES